MSSKKNKSKINSRRKIHCKIKRSYYKKKIKAKNINLLKRKFKINTRNQKQHLGKFLIISKALKHKFVQVSKNKLLKNNKNNWKMSLLAQI